LNISALFIRRPVATTLLAIAILISGALAYFRLPVAPLPNIAFPVIVVQANMAGASPDIMASTVAEPLERRLATIADVSELTSISYVGSSMIVVVFGLNRDINGAARDVEAAIQAARADLPTTLRSNPTYRQYNPADAPIMVLSLTSDTLTKAQLYDSADSVIQQQLSQVKGVGQITLGGGALPSVRVELQPGKLNSYGIGLEDVRAAISAANADSAKGHLDEGNQRYVVTSNDQITKAAPYRDLVVAYRNGAAVQLRDVAEVKDSNENIRNAGLFNGKSAILVIVYPMPGSNVVNTVAQIFVALAGVFHLAVFAMESVLFRKPSTYRRFLIKTQEEAEVARPWAFNQGFYNLFLAIGTFAGLGLVLLGHPGPGLTLVKWNCLFMLGAAIVLVASAPQMRRGAIIQGAAPLLFLLLALVHPAT